MGKQNKFMTKKNRTSMGPIKVQTKTDKPYKNNTHKEKEVRLQKKQLKNAVKTQKVSEAKAEKERLKQEKEERIQNYKKKRLERTKAISKKTRRGQPLMKDRIQLILKQIEQMKRNH